MATVETALNRHSAPIHPPKKVRHPYNRRFGALFGARGGVVWDTATWRDVIQTEAVHSKTVPHDSFPWPDLEIQVVREQPEQGQYRNGCRRERQISIPDSEDEEQEGHGLKLPSQALVGVTGSEPHVELG